MLLSDCEFLRWHHAGLNRDKSIEHPSSVVVNFVTTESSPVRSHNLRVPRKARLAGRAASLRAPNDGAAITAAFTYRGPAGIVFDLSNGGS